MIFSNLFHIAAVHAATDINANVNKELGSGLKYYTKLVPVLDSGWSIGNIIDTVLNILFYVGGVVAIIFLLWGGISYIASAGDESKATKARNTILNAIIGIVIILLAVAIQAAATRIFKGDSTSTSSPTPVSDQISL
ncbi:MAG: pilin [Patescibacteria group bacterium]|jgi:hypothetical protein